MIKGNDLVIYVGGALFAAIETCSLEVRSGLVGVASGNSASEDSVGDYTEWVVAADTMIETPIATLLAMTGTQVNIEFGIRGTGASRNSGVAIVQNVEAEATVGRLCRAHFNFVGSGILTPGFGDYNIDFNNDFNI